MTPAPEPSPLPLPPVEYLRLVGNTDSEADFLAVGRGVADMLEHYGLVRAGARLLDVGCGCGRVARHLLATELAAYVGFDRNPDLVAWAAREIGRRDARFRFEVVPVASPYDELDGHRGTVAPANVSLAHLGTDFDAALAASVFTHVPLAECLRYLAATRGLLRPGGRLLASWYVVETVSEWHFGLAYYHPRAALEHAFAELGFEARALNPGAGRPARAEDAPTAQEWYLLTRAR